MFSLLDGLKNPHNLELFLHACRVLQSKPSFSTAPAQTSHAGFLKMILFLSLCHESFLFFVRCPDENSWTVLFKIVLRHFALARPLICTVSAGAHGNRRARSSRQTADQSDTATRFHIPQFHLLAVLRLTLWSVSRRSATLSFQSRLTCAHCVTCTSRTGWVRWSLVPVSACNTLQTTCVCLQRVLIKPWPACSNTCCLPMKVQLTSVRETPKHHIFQGEPSGEVPLKEGDQVFD